MATTQRFLNFAKGEANEAIGDQVRDGLKQLFDPDTVVERLVYDLEPGSAVVLGSGSLELAGTAYVTVKHGIGENSFKDYPQFPILVHANARNDGGFDVTANLNAVIL